MADIKITRGKRRYLAPMNTVFLGGTRKADPPPPPPKKKNIFLRPVKITESVFSQKPLGKIPKAKPPAIEKWWTTLYYGHRGSGKTLHQAKDCLSIFAYLEYLYDRKPYLKRSIVYSVQKFSPDIEQKYLGRFLYYWKDARDLRYCPREKCWKGSEPHRLHSCYLVFDDIATILPADNWNNTPIWMRKMFAQARHFGIRILANLQDPMSVDINFRRYVDMAFRFRKIMGSPDPDETKPPIKRIWGIYLRRRIKAEWLWKFGDMSDDEIIIMKEKLKRQSEISGSNHYSDIWRASYHWISASVCKIYDTTQDVPEYKPSGYEHEEIGCIDPRHNHDDPKADNYCGYKKVIHKLT